MTHYENYHGAIPMIRRKLKELRESLESCEKYSLREYYRAEIQLLEKQLRKLKD